MAYLNPSAIRRAIVERLEGASEYGLRAVDMGEAEQDIIDGADESTKAFRALVRPVFSVEFEIDRLDGSPMGPNPPFFYEIDVKVKITYNLKGQEPQSVDYADRKAIAERHADMFSQALTEPRSLDTCLATGESTGISSGMLRTQSPLYRITSDDPDNAIFQVEQSYKAIVQVGP